MTILERYKILLQKEQDPNLRIELSYRIFILDMEKTLKEQLDTVATFNDCAIHLKNCEFWKNSILLPLRNEPLWEDSDNKKFSDTVHREFLKYRCIVKVPEYKAKMNQTLRYLTNKWYEQRQKNLNL